MYQGTGELKNFQSSQSSTQATNHSNVQVQSRYKSDVNH